LREAALKEHLSARLTRQRRAVNTLYQRYISEKQSAKDMLEATLRLRRSNAEDDVKSFYPSVNPGTRLFQILVDFEEQYSASPFFEVMIDNNKSVIHSRMPHVPYCRLLMKPYDMERVVRRVLEQSKLSRVLQSTGVQSK
jgi:transcription termination factor NusB